jgi:hypothetical protein
MNKLLIICLFYFIAAIIPNNTIAQEKETNELFINPTRLTIPLNKQTTTNKNHLNHSLTSASVWQKYFFETDTLSLPVRDDFSQNSLTSYDTAMYPTNYKRNEIAYSFKVNGTVQDTLSCVFKKTYQYFFNASTKTTDSTPNPSISLDFYLDYYNPFKKTTTKIVYPTTIRIQYDTLGQIVKTDTIKPDTTYYLKKDTIRVINLAGRYSIWTDHHVYLNDNYPINPPTITAATFDGLDSTGMPYDFSKANTYGVADYLTSKPIDLKSNIALNDTTVYVSFFYQAQGNGNAPEEEDSLVLEVYSPLIGYWKHLWSISNSAANSNQEFKQVILPLRDTLLFSKGVRFRFKNYATLSGDFDHWHIDYFRLDRNRTKSDTIIYDLAISAIDRTFLKNFYVMPYKYFKTDPENYLKNTVSCSIRNLSNLSPTTPSLALNIYHNGSLAYNKNYGIVPFTPGQTRTIALPRETYTFSTTMPEYWSDFKVLYNFSSTISPASDLRTNDTINFNQAFRNYFQRDDGSVEAAYYINGTGSVAVQFQVPQTDTLRAIDLILLPQNPNSLNALFKIKVWEDSAGLPGKTLYESPNYINPSVTPRNYPNLFIINPPVIVNNYFHIGYYQEGSEILYVGFDKNTNNNTFTSYNVDGNWYKSIKNGTPIIRPWLGFDPNVSISENVISTNKSVILIYPNPANHLITIFNNYQAKYCIYNSIGQCLLTGQIIKGENTIDVSNLSEGFYLIQLIGDNTIKTLPLVIKR